MHKEGSLAVQVRRKAISYMCKKNVFLSLLYIAQELELLEQRGQGIKTKAETQAKYGW